MYIGEKIRKERGISRQRLSELSGVPYRTLDNYEKKSTDWTAWQF